MDQEAVAALRSAGIDVTFEENVPGPGVRTNEAGDVVALGEEVAVVAGERVAFVRLKRISELWVGDARPPSFSRGPTPEYALFFSMIEMTAADFCFSTGRMETDEEFERLYNHLRRRPDGTDRNPLFSYLQGAARLYLSLRGVSRAEFEAVVGRLRRSAKNFAIGARSTNYLEIAIGPLIGHGGET